MQEIINGMQRSFNLAGGSVGLSSLFMAGLIALWYSKFERKSEVTALFWYALGMLVFVINPLYILFVERKAPSLSKDNLYLWLIPTVPVILYSGVSIISLFNTKNRVRRIAFIVGLLGILVLAVTTSYSGFSIRFCQNGSYFEEQEQEIFDKIDNYRMTKDMEFVTIIGPNEIVEDARKYSGYYTTLYGKDLWRGEIGTQFEHSYESWQYELYNRIQEPEKYWENIADISYRNGCEFVVFSKQRFIAGEIEIPESLTDLYVLVFDNDKYLLYEKAVRKNE